MSAAFDLVYCLASEHPEFYADLLTRQLPAGWRPNAESTAQVLSNMNRDGCWTCEKAGGSLRCSGCHVARYCAVECQRLDWNEHKKECSFVRLAKAAMKEQLTGGHLDAPN